jgi:hypothetical protein
MKTKMHFSFRVDIWDDAGDGFVERLRYEIDPQWRGEIPRTMLIARDGATTVIDGVADLKRVRAWLDAQSSGVK